MEFYAAQARISALEEALTRPWDADVLAATVALAWYLRQRDSARALRLVDGVVPLLASHAERDPRRARPRRCCATSTSPNAG